MKVCLFVAAAGLAACAVARPVEVGGLPTWSLADTEVSTNVPFAFAKENVRHLLLSLALAGTPSNNVQVAFGRDVNTNGVLEIGETGLLVGWDCGRWTLRGGAEVSSCLTAGGVWTAESATTDTVKQLELDLGIRKAMPKEIVAQENGVSLSWNLPEKLPLLLYDRSWNMLRLTVRGIDVADESLRAQLSLSGTIIIIR